MAAIIARASDDFLTSGRFRGVFHYMYNDRAPTCLGRTLFEIYHGVAAPAFLPYRGDVDAMLRYLVDENPLGWHSIVVKPECDCAMERASRRSEAARNRCYCILKPTVALPQFLEYDSLEATEISFEEAAFAYVLDPKNNMMHVLGAVTQDGRRIDCSLAKGDSPFGWTVCGSVALNGPEADWDAFTYGYEEVRLYDHYEAAYEKLSLPNDLGSLPCCPFGHAFIISNGYREGDRCQAWGEPDRETNPCSHVFELPENSLPGHADESLVDTKPALRKLNP